MPAPRARKSAVPDPDLYADPDPDPHTHRPKPAAALARRGSRGPQPTRGSVTTDTGRRRSSRLSNESQHSQDHDSAAPTRAPAAVQPPARSTNPHDPAHPHKPAPRAKGKKRPLADNAPDDSAPPGSAAVDRARPRTGAATATATGAGAGAGMGANKRPRVAEVELVGDEARATGPPVASGSQGVAAPPRRGFVPRAVADLAARVKKPPPEYSTVLVDDDAADADPFPFTTNPPTPHAKSQTTRPPAAKGGKAPRIARPAASPSSSASSSSPDDDDLTPDSAPAPAKASTSRVRRRGAGGVATPPRAQGDGATALAVHETPVQVKNIALRAGLGPGTPATAARGGGGPGSARRSSVRGSGKRGSSIGGGFDAVPHPQVADDKLYRSTDGADPLARRLRSLLSWASQRARGRVLREAGDGLASAAEQAAKDVMDSWIDDVCALRVDTSVPLLEPSSSYDPAALPPHPQNVSNAARLVELEAAYAAIAAEQAARHALEPAYEAWFDRRAAAHARPAPARAWGRRGGVGAAGVDAEAFAARLDTAEPVTAALSGAEEEEEEEESAGVRGVVRGRGRGRVGSVDAARALGRRVLAGELFGRAADAATDAAADARADKGKGKGKGKPAEVPAGEAGRQVTDAQIATAHLAHLAHRLSAFARVAQAYVAHRGGETYAALARLGSPSSPSSSSLLPVVPAAAGPGPGPGPGPGEDAPGLAVVAAAAVGGAGAADPQVQVDARELLRAIAGADAR